MNYGRTFKMIILGVLVLAWFASNASAAEIITVADFEQRVVTEDQLIKMADNAIILFDSSVSMSELYKNTGKSRYDIAKDLLVKGNQNLPNLGYNMGIYLYTPWTPIYELQPYNRQEVAKALEKLPEKADGLTLLVQGLQNLKPMLDNLAGHTVVFLFSDGSYTKSGVTQEPRYYFEELAENYDVCFYIISSAKSEVNEKMLKAAETISPCSQVIPFDNYIWYPQYQSGALYVVNATVSVETIMEKKVVGLKTDNILFEFNKYEIQSVFYQELDEIGKFFANNPNAYLLINGYTDSVGSKAYNYRLSRKRAEAVASYLKSNHNIGWERIVTLWYGKSNPIASNANDTGRALNRRVELAVALGD